MFWMQNLTKRWAQSEPFFPKSGHLFEIFKRAGEVSSLATSCVSVSVAEYASVSWISLNILENV